MEFDWVFYDDNWSVKKKQIEEVFEDPFNLRLMPDTSRFSGQSRFICLGQDSQGNYLTIVYTTNGKSTRVIAARKMSMEECGFYAQRLHRNL
jgi:uncharacterized DUF497 family protein